MTTLAPSPAEQAEIDRFGAFDEEKFAEIIEHHDDDVTCTLKYVTGRTCGNPATHRAQCRTCKRHLGLVCDKHARQVPGDMTLTRHPVCGTQAPLGALVEVVPL